MMTDHDCETMRPCPACSYEPYPAELDIYGGECPACGFRPLGVWE